MSHPEGCFWVLASSSGALRVSQDGPSRILRKFDYSQDGQPALEEVYRVTESGEDTLLRSTRYEDSRN